MRQHEQPLWIARARWRVRGAMLPAALLVLVPLEIALVHLRPISGERTDLGAAILIVGFLNLGVVALLAPVAGGLLRRARPDLPKVIARDRAGLALAALVAGGLLAAGVANHGHVVDAERDLEEAQLLSAALLARELPPGYDLADATTLVLGGGLHRTCAPGPDPDREICAFADPTRDPPLVRIDPERTPNERYRR